jgi:hypothetical protein
MALDKLKHQYTEPLQVSSLSVDGDLNASNLIINGITVTPSTYLTTSTAASTYARLSVSNTFTANNTFSGTVSATAAPGTTTSASQLGYIGLPQNSTTTGAYTITAADSGKHIYSTVTRTITIDSNANLPLPIGTTVTFIAGFAAGPATVTIAITTDTMYLAGPGTTGSRTLAAFGMATAVKVASTTWFISGNGLT